MAKAEAAGPSTAGHGGDGRGGGGAGDGPLVLGCRIGVSLGDTWAGTLGRLQVCVCARTCVGPEQISSLLLPHFTRTTYIFQVRYHLNIYSISVQFVLLSFIVLASPIMPVNRVAMLFLARASN